MIARQLLGLTLNVLLVRVFLLLSTFIILLIYLLLHQNLFDLMVPCSLLFFSSHGNIPGTPPRIGSHTDDLHLSSVSSLS